MASSINGFGTTYYGERDYWPDGSYITTEWVVFLYLPLFPIRSFRLRFVVSLDGGAERQFVVYEKTRPNLKQVGGMYFLILLGVLTVYWGFKKMDLLAQIFGIGPEWVAFLPFPVVALLFATVFALRRRAKKIAGLVSARERERREEERIKAAMAETGRSICPRYRLSGRIGHVLWLVPPTAAVAAIFLAGIYSWIDLNWRTYDIVAVFQTMIFSSLVAVITGLLIQVAKCRNMLVARVLGIAVGTFTVYVAWVWFEFFLILGAKPTETNETLLWKELFLNPRSVYTVAAALNEHGTYTRKKENSGEARPVEGLELAMVWLGEAAIMIGGIVWVSAMLIKHRPFCERCQRWATPWAQSILFKPTDTLDAEGRVAHGDISGLQGMSRTTATTNPRLSLSIQQCPQCAETATYSLDWLWEVKGRNGVETKINSLTAPRILPAEYASALRTEGK
jgi:hypothetical protein